MKLDKLRMLKDEFAREFSECAADLYYRHEDDWMKLGDPSPLEPATIACLNAALADPVAFHAAKGRTAWFALEEVPCTVSLEFDASPRLGRRKKCRSRLLDALRVATNSYKVTHHPLTQLVSRDAFRDHMALAIPRIAPPKLSGEIQGSAAAQSLSVLALDIDYFKQVNDTYGHRYGDQVLKIFGVRLEQTARQIETVNLLDVRITVGHPSGEEFLICIETAAAKEQVADWADLFRKAISDFPLPSDTEWQWLLNAEALAPLIPPPLQERGITTSIGVVSYGSISHGEPVQEQISRMLDQADTALYRAKAGGRNRVIFFEDILDSYGRVLEHDLCTRIVAIDIGQNVGVTIGQEFKVFPAGFTGKRSFTIEDGRSKRTIGLYPKIELTRITVFNVQPELSFGFISNAAETGLDIELGSHLEAIPLGSIGYLLPHAAKYLAPAVDGTQPGDIASLLKFVKAEAEKQPFAVVFRFTRAKEYRKQYGDAALNSALTRLFRAATGAFHAAEVGLLDTSSVCIVGRKHIYDEKSVQSFVDKLGDELPGLGLTVGIFCSVDIEQKPLGSNKLLSPSHAIEFARFAASDFGMDASKSLTHFNYTTAQKLIKNQFDAGAFAPGAADFEKLQGFGVNNAALNNLGALCYSRLNQLKQAVDGFALAAEMEPNNLIYRSNLGTAVFRSGEIDRGLLVLNTIVDKELVALQTLHPYGYVCYTALLAKARMDGSPNFLASRFAAMAPIAATLDTYTPPNGSLIISAQLAEMTSKKQVTDVQPL